jgi:hypothetical protein
MEDDAYEKMRGADCDQFVVTIQCEQKIIELVVETTEVSTYKTMSKKLTDIEKGLLR